MMELLSVIKGEIYRYQERKKLLNVWTLKKSYVKIGSLYGDDRTDDHHLNKNSAEQEKLRLIGGRLHEQ